MPMVFGIGLPRCGGQTLQAALSILTKKTVVHSPGRSLPQVIGRNDIAGAVEVFAPIPYLLREFPDCKLILNGRPEDKWFASCVSVYGQSKHWNHPIWYYPLTQFKDYRSEYLDCRASYFNALRPKSRTLVIDITKEPEWDRLAAFLDVPVPDQPFPLVDRIKNPVPVPAPEPPRAFDVVFE